MNCLTLSLIIISQGLFNLTSKIRQNVIQVSEKQEEFEITTTNHICKYADRNYDLTYSCQYYVGMGGHMKTGKAQGCKKLTCPSAQPTQDGEN